MIADGAHPLLSARDLLEVLNLTRIPQQLETRNVLSADDVVSKLLRVLNHAPLYMDEIRNQTEMSIERVSAILVMMELKGLVRQVDGIDDVVVCEERATYNA